jgi:transcriptional regulator with XRE-family HTH domain
MPARHFDGRRLREERRAADLTQAELAEAVGVRRATVAKWENGQSCPEMEKLPGLASALSKPLDELFPRDGDPDLTDLRCDAGYPQSRTGEFIGTRSHIPVSNAERGLRRLSDQFVQPLAEAYGVSVDELLAAQERSFGADVPAVRRDDTTAGGTSSDPSTNLPRTLAEKITFLLEHTYTGAPPSDTAIAERGNRSAGRPVLTDGLVRDLRTGRRTEASDEVLGALAAALSAPPSFFQSDAQEVHRIVSGMRLVTSGLAGIAARGDLGQLTPELLDYIANAVEEVRRTEFPDHPGPAAPDDQSSTST